MTEASQSVIDRAAAVQQRFSSTVLAVPTWPLVSHIIPADIPRPTEAPLSAAVQCGMDYLHAAWRKRDAEAANHPIDAAHPIKPEKPDQNDDTCPPQNPIPRSQGVD